MVEAYLLSRVSLSLSQYLGRETPLWQGYRNLEEALKGIKPGTVDDREEWCTSTVEDALGFAVGRFFIERKFTGISGFKFTSVFGADGE